MAEKNEKWTEESVDGITAAPILFRVLPDVLRGHPDSDVFSLLVEKRSPGRFVVKSRRGIFDTRKNGWIYEGTALASGAKFEAATRFDLDTAFMIARREVGGLVSGGMTVDQFAREVAEGKWSN